MPWLRLYADGTPQIETYGEIWQLFWLFHNLPHFFRWHELELGREIPRELSTTAIRSCDI